MINHVEREVRAVLQAANRTRDIRAERDRIIAAAEAGDVNAASWLSIKRIAEAVRRVEMRLERVSQAAELEGRHLAVAALAGQELKAATVAARLGGLGGYATPRNDKSNAAPFSLVINFSGGRAPTRIEGTPAFDDFEAGRVPVAPTVDLPSVGASHSPAGERISFPEECEDENDLDNEDV
jgi:hypothetical protein